MKKTTALKIPNQLNLVLVFVECWNTAAK